MPDLRKTPKADKGTGQKRVLRPCKWCGSTDHYPTFCFNRPKQRIAVRKLPAKIGKQGKKTAAAVAKWKRTQKPNHQGYFICYMCGKWVDYLEAEHVKSKARNPKLRTDPTNLKPTCSACNERKRSKDN